MVQGCTGSSSPEQGGEGVIDQRRKALIAAKAALDKHAEDLVVLDVRALSGVADFFVICTAASHRQMVAMSEHIDEQLRRLGTRMLHAEGLGPSRFARVRRRREPTASSEDGLSWVLMDCGDLIVHLFNPPARHFYQLERLWGDAPRIPVDSLA